MINLMLENHCREASDGVPDHRDILAGSISD